MATWTPNEDEQLRKLVKEYGPKRWSVIASKLKTKGSKQCRRRWKNHLNADLKSGGWTPEEDRILMEGHRLYGNKWTEIAKMVGGRTDNAVKNRYAALCKRDSRGVQRGPAAGRGRRGRKARQSDSDGGASDLDPDEDSDAYEVDDAKRSSSPSSESRDASPVRGGRAHGAISRAESGGGAGSPPQGVAAIQPAAGSSAGRGSVLGRRRQQAGGSPPLQPEPEAAPPAKRRALASGTGLPTRMGGGLGMGKQLIPAPAIPVSESRPQEQRREEGAGSRDAHPSVQPADSSQEESEDLLVTGPGYGGEQGQIRDAGEPSGALGGFAQPKKLPLTINIPNAASAEPGAQPPPTSSVPAYGIEIRVLKDLLSPCEIQYVRELNDMQLPLHINLDDDVSTFHGRGRGGACAEPPLTTSRQAAQNALAALASPTSTTDFNDVLKWFQTGLTPRSTCGEDTPRLMGRLGFTPRGLSGLGGLSSSARGSEDVVAGMFGTGLTPRCLLAGGDGATPSGSLTDSLVATPSRRTRRQIAVAAAVAAAASAGPGPGSAAEGGSQHDPLSQGCGSLGSALAGFGSGGAGGLTSPSGMELHAGHRQLLAKLIQSAAAVEAGAPGGAGCGGASTSGAGRTGAAAASSRPVGRDLRVVPPSPLADDEPTQGTAGAIGGDGGGCSGGVVVTPYFTQQELLMLLEVLNSDDLQALPPPPMGSQQ